MAGTEACSEPGPAAPSAAIPKAGALIQQKASFSDFAPVSSDEMAFALTLFVEAANRRLSATGMPPDYDDEDCKYLYSTLCADVVSLPAAPNPEAGSHTSLYTAFRTLCSYYDGDPLQAAVCARVLAFHFLMVRTAGAVLSQWTQPHPQIVQLVELHPAVVEAIAATRLHGSVLLSEAVFAQLVAEKARSMVTRTH